jgi:D-alanyl-D-alanine carboxypeptidase
MSIFGTAGSGISTTAYLVTFIRALAHGQLLPDDLYQEMIATFPVYSWYAYGLGMSRYTLSCGVQVLGHEGAVDGYESDMLISLDGTRAYADDVPLFPGTDAIWSAWSHIIDAEFCGGQ